MLYHLFHWLNRTGTQVSGKRFVRVCHIPGFNGNVVIVGDHHDLWKKTDHVS